MKHIFLLALATGCGASEVMSTDVMDSEDAGVPEAAADEGATRENAAPAVMTNEWTPATVRLVRPRTGPYTFALVSQPAHGWATVTGDLATYHPEPYFDGADSFEYTATADGEETTMIATVTVVESSMLEDGEGVTLSLTISPFQIDFTEQLFTETDTPFTLDRAAFCRLFYDADIDGTEGLWLLAAVKGTGSGDGYFMVRALGLDLQDIAGTEKVLTNTDGNIRAGGDTHAATDGRYFYATAGGCGNNSCTGTEGHATIYRFADDWEFAAQYPFDFDNEDYRSNDMLFSYANRKLFFGLSHSENCGDQPNDECSEGWTAEVTGALLQAFDIETGEYSSQYTLGDDAASSMGASLAFDGSDYWFVGSLDSANLLSASRYTSLSSSSVQTITLSEDGQWPQGAFFDDGRFLAAYHSGDHGSGDVQVAAWNADLSQSNTIFIDVDQTGDPKACGEGVDLQDDSDDCSASNPACAGVECDGTGSECSSCTKSMENAQRPHAVRVRDTVYFAYDLAGETFSAIELEDQPSGAANWSPSNIENRDWECYVGAVAMAAGSW